jgi:hypothetical protein
VSFSVSPFIPFNKLTLIIKHNECSVLKSHSTEITKSVSLCYNSSGYTDKNIYIRIDTYIKSAQHKYKYIFVSCKFVRNNFTKYTK